MSARTVYSLQRELLAICKGARHDWQAVQRVHELRCQIHEINPNAALYFGWCAGEDRLAAETHFHADFARRKGDTPCAT